jgi:DNA-binding GntR family transcriptional regulator
MSLEGASPGHATAARSTSGGSAVDRVYEHLRERIVSFGLPPDTTLSRSDLAREYGVSQTPVREALQRLEEDGLVHVFPQSKTVVARIAPHELQEANFLRVALETEVVRRLAAERNAEVIHRLEAILNMQRALCCDVAEMDMFSELDRRFHRTLFEAVDMPRLNEMLTRRLGHLARCHRLELPLSDKMEWIVRTHAAVVAAIAAGDPEAASEAMRAHLTGTIRRISVLREQYPQYFGS